MGKNVRNERLSKPINNFSGKPLQQNELCLKQTQGRKDKIEELDQSVKIKKIFLKKLVITNGAWGSFGSP